MTRSGRSFAVSCTASDPDATWAQLMKAWELTDAKIRGMREAIKGRALPLALTECHFTDSGTRPV